MSQNWWHWQIKWLHINGRLFSTGVKWMESFFLPVSNFTVFQPRISIDFRSVESGQVILPIHRCFLDTRAVILPFTDHSSFPTSVCRPLLIHTLNINIKLHIMWQWQSLNKCRIRTNNTHLISHPSARAMSFYFEYIGRNVPFIQCIWLS